jgi:hypothetical protein
MIGDCFSNHQSKDINPKSQGEAHVPAKLKDIVDDTMSLIQTVFKRDQISLEVNVPEDLPKIKCRSQQVQQVIMNLVTNARDALNEKYPEYDENKKIVIFASLLKKEKKIGFALLWKTMVQESMLMFRQGYSTYYQRICNAKKGSPCSSVGHEGTGAKQRHHRYLAG